MKNLLLRAAAHPKIQKFIASRLYAVTDLREWTERQQRYVEDACRGGVDIIQLRAKAFDKETLRKAAFDVREITSRWNVLFIMNDFPDIAREAEADGVHLGQDDASVDQAREVMARDDMLVGKSTHSLKQAMSAEKEGADYIAVGPIFKTPTKPNYSAVGLSLIAEVMKRIAIPVVVIGGIDSSRLQSVFDQGARRVAVVRAVFDQDDAFRAARELKEKILQISLRGAANENHEKC